MSAPGIDEGISGGMGQATTRAQCLINLLAERQRATRMRASAMAATFTGWRAAVRTNGSKIWTSSTVPGQFRSFSY